MDVHNLIHMANRIGEFFDAMPDRAEAQRNCTPATVLPVPEMPVTMVIEPS